MAFAILIAIAAVPATAQGNGSCTPSVTLVSSGPQRTLQLWISSLASKEITNLGGAANVTVISMFSGPAQDTYLTRRAQFASVDIPLEARRLNAAGRVVTTIPVVLGATAFYTSLAPAALSNVPGKRLRLDACTLAKIYTGQITTWDHPDIIKTNPGLVVPRNQPIRPVARSDASNFTTLVSEYLTKACPSVWKLPVNQTITFPAPVLMPAGNGGILSAVRNDSFGICFLDPGTGMIQANISEVALSNPSGRFITTRDPGAFAQAGFSIAERRLPSATQPWTDVSLVYERTRYTKKAAQFPIIFAGFANADLDMTKWGVKGVLVRDYLDLMLSDKVQRANMSSYGWWPLPSKLRKAGRKGVKLLKVDRQGPCQVPGP